MDTLTVVLIVVLVLLVFGGIAYPRPIEGSATVNGALYLVAAVVLIVVLVRVFVGVL